MRRVSCLVILATLLGSCETGADAPSVFFPTWTPESGPVSGGVLEGRLVERAGCLLWSGTGDFLPIWPDTFEFEDGEVITESGLAVALGDTATLGGGERSRAQVEELMGQEIPSRCRSVDSYWMVTDVDGQV
jgi:hypothetical protein